MNPPEETPNQLYPVKFITEKDSSYRIYHADGAWGTMNASGDIQLNFFVEHDPLPISVLHPITENGNISNDGEITSLNELDKENFIVIRNFQAAMVFDLEAAQSVYTVLGNFIKLRKDSLKTDNSNEKQS